MNRSIRASIAALLVAAAATARSSHDGAVRAQSADPCSTVASDAPPAAMGNVAGAAPSDGAKARPLDHDDRWSHLDSLWAHRAAIAQGRVRATSVGVRATADVGNVAVLQDAGDLMIKPNPADLGDKGLRLTANASGGYDISAVAYGFRQPLGTAIALSDDATQ
jgi:hypothetical protein